MPGLWYRESGLETGHPLIFLHGLFASMQNWQIIAKRCAPHFRVLNVDLLNHGNSPHTPSIDYFEMRDAVIELLETHLDAPAHLVGHSMGGKVAMLVSLERPDLVDKLVIEDIAPKEYPQWFAPIIRALVNLPLDQLKSRAEADERLKDEIPDSNLRTFLLTNMVRAQDQSFRWRVNLDALVSGGPSIAGFPEVQGQNALETLVIRGGKSLYVADEDEGLLKTYFPNLRFETFVEADHWVHAREPERFAQAVNDFLLA